MPARAKARKVSEGAKPLAFTTRQQWRAWLKANHATAKEAWLLYHKKRTGKPSIRYEEAVEEALCFGWIDTTVKSLDADRYMQRYTPRKPGSTWSALNRQRVQRLVRQRRMTQAGLAAYQPHIRAEVEGEARRWRRTPPDLKRALDRSAKARAAWAALAPGYRRGFIRWCMLAKQPRTRARRVARTVAMVAAGEKQAMG